MATYGTPSRKKAEMTGTSRTSQHAAPLEDDDLGEGADFKGVATVAEAAARRARAVRARLAGASYREIAEQLGYADKSSAYRAVMRSIDRVEVQAVEDLRDEENARLDRAQFAIWQQVLDGDLNAVNTFLRLSKRRADLNGLDAPRAIDVSTTVRGEMETALDDLQEIILAAVISDEEALADEDENSVGLLGEG